MLVSAGKVGKPVKSGLPTAGVGSSPKLGRDFRIAYIQVSSDKDRRQAPPFAKPEKVARLSLSAIVRSPSMLVSAAKAGKVVSAALSI